MSQKLITPSILNVSVENRPKVIDELIDLGIKWFHFDVMDNKFVPNTAMSIDEIINFRKKCKKYLCDVHLMVETPFEYARKLTNYVTCITVHYESFKSEKELIDFVNEFSHQNWIGLAIKPNTRFEDIQHLIYLFDLVLVMSVEPGFGGQKFIEDSYEKIKKIKNFIDEEKLPTIIQVDGGVNDLNSKRLFEIGTTYNVVGSYLMNNLNKETLKKLK